LKEARLTWVGGFLFRREADCLLGSSGFRIGRLTLWQATWVFRCWVRNNDHPNLAFGWLHPKIKSSWLQDLGFEFFITPMWFYSQSRYYGRECGGGIWAPNVPIPGAHLVTKSLNISTPDWKEEWIRSG
jgi:hypothetical protein